ncbi:hypothetical protein NDI49_31530 [Trichocoleus sp. ST-U3]
MTVTTYKWTIERYHRAIDAGLFDVRPYSNEFANSLQHQRCNYSYCQLVFIY